VLEQLERVGLVRLAQRASETVTAYRMGQAGLSRRLLGKAGAIA
jgi:hypothetical protein